MVYRDEALLTEAIADRIGGGGGVSFIVIDGRCGTGKTTLAEKLGRTLGAPVIHTDDFYLPKEERTPERMKRCGGNIDSERLCRQVLIPLENGEGCIYRPYDCGKGTFSDEVEVPESRVYIIEGTYSHMICPDAAVSVFVTASQEEQMRRLALRESAEKLEAFRNIWIPSEERYFSLCRVEASCTYIFDTSDV